MGHSPTRVRAPMQRLAEENREQQELIQSLLLRVDNLETSLHGMVEEARAKQQIRGQSGRGWFGGFLGPRAA